MREPLVRVACLLVVLPLLGGCRAPLAALEHALVFHPTSFPRGDWRPNPDLYEDVTFDTPDGHRLHGWLAEASRPRAVVLYCHGNAGNITSRRHVLRLYRDRLNCTVLIFDYRGYGRSAGTPSEEGLLTDARAARRWLAERTGVAEGDIILVGHSLGGGVATDLAAFDGARGLILENTFTSVPDAAEHHCWPLRVGGLMQTRLDSQAKIHLYRGPLLQTHGDADWVVPFALGRQLFEAANEPKRFVHVPGGGHNDPPNREYFQALHEFLQE